jgi:large subunit ribosomal protein L21
MEITNMNAIIESGGKQFCVQENDTIEVELLQGNKGDKIVFSDILAAGAGKDIKLGKPFVPGAKVEAEIITHLRGKKITVFKMKRRKGYKRKQGHRQELTKLRIISVSC